MKNTEDARREFNMAVSKKTIMIDNIRLKCAAKGHYEARDVKAMEEQASDLLSIIRVYRQTWYE